MRERQHCNERDDIEVFQGAVSRMVHKLYSNSCFAPQTVSFACLCNKTFSELLTFNFRVAKTMAGMTILGMTTAGMTTASMMMAGKTMTGMTTVGMTTAAGMEYVMEAADMLAVAANTALADKMADKMAAANEIAVVDVLVGADEMTAMSALPQSWKYVD